MDVLMIFTIDDVSQDVLDLIIKYEIYSNIVI